MMAKKFTGFHMATVLITFFGVVIAVNLLMARFALGTFGGTVVDNSYVASQKFNGWIAQGRAQDRLGWSLVTALPADRHPVLTLAQAGTPLLGATLTGTAQHPAGKNLDRVMRFAALPDGQYRAMDALPAGRWTLMLDVAQGGQTLRRKVVVQ